MLLRVILIEIFEIQKQFSNTSNLNIEKLLHQILRPRQRAIILSRFIIDKLNNQVDTIRDNINTQQYLLKVTTISTEYKLQATATGRYVFMQIQSVLMKVCLNLSRELKGRAKSFVIILSQIVYFFTELNGRFLVNQDLTVRPRLVNPSVVFICKNSSPSSPQCKG